MQELDYATNQQVTNNVTLVNNLAGQVASLNTQIARALASGHQPNDLLDARDQIIREINQYVQTTQVDADSGAINLFVGGSQALVLGSSTGQLSVAETAEYPGSGKLSLYFSQPNGERVELTANMVGGGEIAGLLKFNNDDLVTRPQPAGPPGADHWHRAQQPEQAGLDPVGRLSAPTCSS